MSRLDHHIIQRHVFEVTVDQESKAQQVGDRVRDLFHQHLQSGLNRLFGQLNLTEKHLKVDQLTIDLGAIHYDQLNESLVTKILEQLAMELSQLESKTPYEGVVSIARNEEHLDLLRHFLLEGVLPWNTVYTVNGLWHRVAFEAPQNMAKLLRKYGQSWTIRRRIADRMTGELASHIVHALEPTHAPIILSYHSNLLALNQENKYVQLQGPPLERHLWLLVLSYLLVEQTSAFNTKALVKSTLRQLASRYNVSFTELVQLLGIGLQRWNLPKTPALLRVFQEISDEHQISGPASTESHSEGWGIQSALVFLETGDLGHLHHFSDTHNLSVLLSESLDQEPQTLTTWLRKLAQPKPVVVRMAQQLEAPLLPRVVKALAPTEFEQLQEYHQQLHHLHTQDPLVPSSATQLHRDLWQWILLGVLDHKGSRFNQRQYLRQLLQQMADHHNVQFQPLLAHVVQLAQRHSKTSSRAGQFISLLLELSEDQPLAEMVAGPSSALSTIEQEQLAQLRELLEHWAAQQSPNIDAGETLWLALRRYPEATLALLREYSHRDTVMAQLAKALPASAYAPLVQQLDRKYAAHFLSVWPKLKQIQAMLTQESGKAGPETHWLPQILLTGMLRRASIHPAAMVDHIVSRWATHFSLKAAQIQVLLETEGITYSQTQASEAPRTSENQMLQQWTASLTRQWGQRPSQQLLHGLDSLLTAQAIAVAQALRAAPQPSQLITLLGYLPHHLWLRTVAALTGTSVYQVQVAWQMLRKQAPNLATGELQYYISEAIPGQQHLDVVVGRVRQLLPQPLALSIQDSLQLPSEAQLEATYYPQALTAALENEVSEVIISTLTTGLQQYPEALRAYLQELPADSPYWTRIAEVLSHSQWMHLLSILTGYSTAQLMRWERAAHQWSRQLSQQVGQRLSIGSEWRAEWVALWRKHGSLSPATLGKGLLKYWQHQHSITWNQTTTRSSWEGVFPTLEVDVPRSTRPVRVHPSKQSAEGLLELLREQLENPDEALMIQKGYRTIAELTAFLMDYHDGDLWRSLIQWKPIVRTAWLAEASIQQKRQLLSRRAGLAGQAHVLLKHLERELSRVGYHKTTALLNAATEQIVALLLDHPHAEPEALLLLLEQLLDTLGLPESWVQRLTQTQAPNPKSPARRVLEPLWDSLPKAKDNLSIPFFKEEEEGVDYYVANAGLILLHPYLGHFFGQLGYLNAFNKFESPEKAAQGAMLLQYLYNLQTTQDEEGLALNKAMCGLALHDPVPPEYEPTAQEKDMCDQMVMALCSHWTVAKSHDVAGFRDTWLWRSGRLTQKSDKYELTVDQRPYDLLLDSLPYTLSPAVLSWSDKQILVNWR